MDEDRLDQMIAYLETEAKVHITPTDSNPPIGWDGELLLCATYRLPSVPVVSYMVWYCWDNARGLFVAYELTAHGVHRGETAVTRQRVLG